MPKEPQEIGGGASRLNEGETREFFNAALNISRELFGDHDLTLASLSERSHMNRDGSYASFHRTVINDGYGVQGFLLVAQYFSPFDQDDQELLKENFGGEEEEAEEYEITQLFFGKLIELRFNSSVDGFKKIETMGRLTTDITGRVDIEEVESLLGETDDTLAILLEADSRLATTEDYLALNDIRNFLLAR